MTPRRLTLDQRARRRATRKNNQVRAAYPLLAQAGVIEDWLTTPEQAKGQIEEFERVAKNQLQYLADARVTRQQEAAQLRARVATLTDAKTMALLDAHLAKVYPTDYAAGFWQRVLDGRFDIHAYIADLDRLRLLGEQARAASRANIVRRSLKEMRD